MIFFLLFFLLSRLQTRARATPLGRRAKITAALPRLQRRGLTRISFTSPSFIDSLISHVFPLLFSPFFLFPSFNEFHNRHLYVPGWVSAAAQRRAIERKRGGQESKEELHAGCSRPSQGEAARTCHRWDGSSHETCLD